MATPAAVAPTDARGDEVRLDDYFNFLSPDDIRIRGHRIGIESVLYQYLHCNQTPEQIAELFPTLSLEQIYATILLYLRREAELSHYMSDWLAHGSRMRDRQESDPPTIVSKLRGFQAARHSSASNRRRATRNVSQPLEPAR